jgi:dihydrofolate reductase
MSENRVIGKDNAMPWSLKPDMEHFRKLTLGWPCIMGRKTWESLPRRPLPGRPNIVLSHSMPAASLPDATIFPSLGEAIKHCSRYEKIFICGGATIYAEALGFADKIELTVLHSHYDGDVFFPEINPALWKKTWTDDFDGFSFISYSRIQI